MQPEYSVIIPVFNKWELTRDCLARLREHADGHDFEVVVVDNASSDVTATDLAPLGKSLFGERFTAIRFEENRNFGPACNVGAKAATAPLLFFLNNDTLVTSGWAAPLLSALRDEPELGAVGPLLLYPNDTVQHLGVAYAASGAEHLYRDFPRTHPVVAKHRDVQCLTGAALMLSASLFRECGCFHEEYKNGYEDQELCVHIRQAGKKLRCVPQSVIYHLESQSGGRDAAEGDNSDLFFKRCGKHVHTDIHVHAMRDGFDVFINDLMLLSIKLSEAEERKLTREVESQPAQAWAALMAQNPLWIGGPEFFADICAKQGQYDKELLFRLQLANMAPTLKRYMDVMQLEPYFPKNSPWEYKFKEKMAVMQLCRRSPDAAHKKLRFLQKCFPPENPAFLERICREKLERLFPE